MLGVMLRLTTHNGNELGRLLLEGVQIAEGADTHGSVIVRPRTEQMDRVYERIATALAQEGLEVALDDIDFQITVSRALLHGSRDGEGVHIALPVRDTPQSALSGAEHVVPATGTWDDLFDLKEDTDEPWS